MKKNQKTKGLGGSPLTRLEKDKDKGWETTI